MDEHIIATALKKEELREMLQLYLIDQGDEPADRSSLLKFAKEFDKERKTNFLALLKNFKAADIEQLLDAYRNTAEVETTAAPKVQTVLATKPKTSPEPAVVPTTSVKPLLRVVKRTPAPAEPEPENEDEIPDWVSQLRATPAPAPAAPQVRPVRPAAAISPGFSPAAAPTVVRKTAAPNARRLPDLLGKFGGLNRKAAVFVGGIVIFLAIIGGALLFVINLQKGSEGITAPPAPARVQPAAAPQSTPVAAPTAATPRLGVQSAPTGSYNWNGEFGLSPREVGDWIKTCNLSADQAYSKLKTIYPVPPNSPNRTMSPANLAVKIKNNCNP